MEKRFLITGGLGFVGRALMEMLSAAGYCGIATSRNPSDIHLPKGWEMRTRNEILSSKENLGIDTIIHLEVKQHVFNPGKKDLEEFKEINVGGTKDWLAWATQQNIERFIFFSTIKATLPKGPPPWNEDSEFYPANTPYGVSKFMAEQSVRNWVDESPNRRGLILRPAVIYGPGHQGNLAAMSEAIRKGHFFLAGKNNNIKSLVSITRLCAATIKLAEGMRSGTELFYVTDEESLTVREIAHKIAKEHGKKTVPTMPYFFVYLLAVFGSCLQKITGKAFPINVQRLEALTETTHFCSKRLQYILNPQEKA